MRTALPVSAMLLLFAALLAIPVASQGAETLPPDVITAFHSAQRTILYSLDPASERKGAGFHDFRIVSSAPVENAAVRQHLVGTLQRQLEAGGGVAMCFIPHHGVRLISGRTIYDMVICYQCGHVLIYSTGRAERLLSISGDKDYLDEILATAKALSAPRKK